MDKEELKKLISKNSTFTHKEKAHNYKVEEILISKHPDSGEWYEAILYIQLETSRRFVRSIESFIENFIVKI